MEFSLSRPREAFSFSLSFLFSRGEILGALDCRDLRRFVSGRTADAEAPSLSGFSPSFPVRKRRWRANLAILAGSRSRRRRREALSPESWTLLAETSGEFRTGRPAKNAATTHMARRGQRGFGGRGLFTIAATFFPPFFSLSLSLSLSHPPTPSELPIPNAAAFKRPLRSLGRSSYSKSPFPTNESNVSGISQLCTNFYLYKLEMCLWLS